MKLSSLARLQRLFFVACWLLLAWSPQPTQAQCTSNPLAHDDEAVIHGMEPRVIDVLANDRHACGSPLSISSATPGVGCTGELLMNVDSTLTYIPSSASSAVCTVIYTAVDQGTGSDTAQLEIFQGQSGGTVGLTPLDERRRASIEGVSEWFALGPEVTEVIVGGEVREIPERNLSLLDVEPTRQDFYWRKILALLALYELGVENEAAVEQARRLIRFQFYAFPGPIGAGSLTRALPLQVRNQAMRVYLLYRDLLFPQGDDPENPDADIYNIFEDRMRSGATLSLTPCDDPADFDPAWCHDGDNSTPCYSCGSTENHMTIYNSFKLLSKQVAGVPFNDPVYVDIREWWLDYLAHSIDVGFQEWGSSGYFSWSLEAILNLAEFSQDEELRVMAEMALDYQLAIFAEQSASGGNFASGSVRFYPWEFTGNLRQVQTHIAQTLFTGGDLTISDPSLSSHSVDFAVSNFRPLQLVADLFVDPPVEVTSRFTQRGRYRGYFSPWYHHNYRGTTYSLAANMTPRRNYYHPHDTGIAFLKSSLSPLSHIAPFGYHLATTLNWTGSSHDRDGRDGTTAYSERAFGYRNVVIYTHGGIRPQCPSGSQWADCNPPNQPPRLHVTDDFIFERDGDWAFFTNVPEHLDQSQATYVAWRCNQGYPKTEDNSEIHYLYSGYVIRSSHENTSQAGLTCSLEAGDAASFGSYDQFKNNVKARNTGSFNGRDYVVRGEGNIDVDLEYELTSGSTYRYWVNGSRQNLEDNYPRAESPRLQGNTLSVAGSTVVFDAGERVLAGDINRVPSGFAFGQGLLPAGSNESLTVVGPFDVDAIEGEVARLYVNVSGGTPPYSFLWQRESSVQPGVFADINEFGPYSGVGTGALTIDPVSGVEEGLYRCIVTDDDGVSAGRLDVVRLTVTPIERAPILVAEKTDALVVDHNGDSQAERGDTLEYTVEVSNVGIGPASQVVITDELGDWLTFVDGSAITDLGSVSVSVSGNVLEVTVGELAPDTSVTVTFRAEIDSTAGIGVNHVSNQAIVTAQDLAPERTDDPDTPVLDDATVTPLGNTPVREEDVAMALESLGEGLTYESGALAVYGWATAFDGIDSLSLDTHVGGGLLGFEYGWPRPEICEYTERVLGFRDANCPNVGFRAIVDTRALSADHGVANPFSLTLEGVSSSGRQASRTQAFWLQNETDIRGPKVGFTYPDPVIRFVQQSDSVVLSGWAVDDTGVRSLTVTLDEGTADEVVLPASQVAYGATRPDVCQAEQGYGDPNCRIHDFSRVGWQVLLDTSTWLLGSSRTLTVKAEDAWGKTRIETLSVEVVDYDPQHPVRPFLGSPLQVPDTVAWSAGFYDLGGPELAYGDQTPGNDLGPQPCELRVDDVELVGMECRPKAVILEAGEWIGFSAAITEPGYYSITYQLLSESTPDDLMHFELDGASVTAPTSTCPQDAAFCNGFQTIENVYLEPNPDQSLRQIRIVVDQGSVTLTGFHFESEPMGTPEPFAGTPPTILRTAEGTKVEAESFDTSDHFIGQSVGYRDKSIGAVGGSTRPGEWVDLEQQGTTVRITDFELGEWLQYSLDVQEGGSYDLELYFANDSDAKGTLNILVDGGLHKQVVIPPTGGGWQVGLIEELNLGTPPPGVESRALQLAPAGGAGFEVDWIRIKAPTACPATANDDGFGDSGLPAAGFTVPFGGTWSDSLWGKVLSNDLPGPADLSIPRITRYPAGTLEVSGSGVTYTPPSEYQALDSFEYQVYSGGDPACGDTATVHLTLAPPPAPNAAFDRQCVGYVCTFDAAGSSGEGLSFAWDLGDGSEASSQAVSHGYSAAGTYAGRLTVTDVAGQTDSVVWWTQLIVGVDDSLEAPFGTATELPIAHLLANDLGPQRLFGGIERLPTHGTLTTTAGHLVYTPSSCSGFDSFDYRVESPQVPYGGDTATVGLSITPDPPPTPDFEVSCAELSCTLTDRSSDANGYQVVGWELGDGNVASGSAVNHQYIEAGTYQVRLLLRDSCGQTASLPKVVTVEAAPNASITAACEQLDCHFDGSGSSDDVGISHYRWQLGDGSESSGVVARHSFAAAGTYEVRLTVTDALGQPDEALVSVTVTDDQDYEQALFGDPSAP